MNKNLGIIIVVAIVILGGIYFYTRMPSTSNTGDTKQDKNATTGRVVFSVSDAAADMSAISEISMKVSKIDIHSTAYGWVTVSASPHTYNLLALKAKDKPEVFSDTRAKLGTYNQVRLVVDSISVKTKDGATKVAKLPSNELKINTTLIIKGGTTASANFDFMADKSLHTASNGSYIFAPVVKTQTKSSANVMIDSHNIVTIKEGHLDNENTVGMDIDGSVKINFQINSGQRLELDSSNKIKIGL